MEFQDIQRKLVLIRVRQLVAQLCRRSGHGRYWFYRALKGEVSIVDALPLIDELLSVPPTNQITLLREEISVILERVIGRAELARRLKVSRQTVSAWEQAPEVPVERLEKIRKALLGIAISEACRS